MPATVVLIPMALKYLLQVALGISSVVFLCTLVFVARNGAHHSHAVVEASYEAGNDSAARQVNRPISSAPNDALTVDDYVLPERVSSGLEHSGSARRSESISLSRSGSGSSSASTSFSKSASTSTSSTRTSTSTSTGTRTSTRSTSETSSSTLSPKELKPSMSVSPPQQIVAQPYVPVSGSASGVLEDVSNSQLPPKSIRSASGTVAPLNPESIRSQAPKHTTTEDVYSSSAAVSQAAVPSSFETASVSVQLTPSQNATVSPTRTQSASSTVAPFIKEHQIRITFSNKTGNVTHGTNYLDDFYSWQKKQRSGAYYCYPPSKWLQSRIGRKKRECNPLLSPMRHALESLGYTYHRNPNATNVTMLLLYGADEFQCDSYAPNFDGRQQLRSCIGKHWSHRFNEKDGLFHALIRYNKSLPSDAGYVLKKFWPRTWVLRSAAQYERFRNATKRINEVYVNVTYRAPMFLFKPVHSDRGEGIIISPNATQTLSVFDMRGGSNYTGKRGYVAQELIRSVLQIEGRRYSVRTWGFIASVRPLIILFAPGPIYAAVMPVNFSDPTTIRKQSILSNSFAQDLAYFNRSKTHRLGINEGGYFGYMEDVADRYGDVNRTWMHSVVMPELKRLTKFVMKALTPPVLKNSTEPTSGMGQFIAIDMSLSAENGTNAFFVEELCPLNATEQVNGTMPMCNGTDNPTAGNDTNVPYSEQLCPLNTTVGVNGTAQVCKPLDNASGENGTSSQFVQGSCISNVTEDAPMCKTPGSLPPTSVRAYLHEVNRAAAYRPGDYSFRYPKQLEMLETLLYDSVYILEEIQYRRSQGLKIAASALTFLGGWQILVDAEDNFIDK